MCTPSTRQEYGKILIHSTRHGHQFLWMQVEDELGRCTEELRVRTAERDQARTAERDQAHSAAARVSELICQLDAALAEASQLSSVIVTLSGDTEKARKIAPGPAEQMGGAWTYADQV
jgi:predicted ATPase